MAARPTFWSRFLTAGGFSWPTFHDQAVMLTLDPGQTLLRTVVSFDFWIETTVEAYIDAGAKNAWGMVFGSSNSTPPSYPATDFSTISPRWIYIDQMVCDIANNQDIAGSIQYLTRNDAHSRYTDTRNQYTNTSLAAEYLWLGWELDSGIPGSPVVTWSASVAGLIMEAP